MAQLKVNAEAFARIERLLREVEETREVEILYACESGSRAWGFASPDSDYDIRFLYRRSYDDQFRVLSGSDSIDLPLVDELDPGGWDLRKSLRLLSKSNGALLEWLHSPIVYRCREAFHTDLIELAQDHFSSRALAHHYRGMAVQVVQGSLVGGDPSGKAYLYALRALLCARHLVQTGKVPPVEFCRLIEGEEGPVFEAIDGLRRWKEQAKESDSPGRIAVVDHFLETGIAELTLQIEDLPREVPPQEPFDVVYRRWMGRPVVSKRPLMEVADFSLERVRRRDLLLFETVSGSRSFGTEHAASDWDLRGVFVAPTSFLTSLETLEQVSDEKSDEVYYEVGRFVSLLFGNNPNLIELLFSPGECVRFQHPSFSLIRPEDFLSGLCRQTFGNYAMGQIRKARGLNKKMVNPEPRERKHLRDFCYVLQGQGSVPLTSWLKEKGISERDCSLVSVPHSPGVYAVFLDPKGRGLFSRKDASSVVCSSVAREAEPVAWMNCHVDAFKAHCRAHREYWHWVEMRNEKRYRNNSEHGKGYDAKNLMHTLRLLDEAIEIAREGRIILPRPNTAWLKRVKSGEFQYDELLAMADERHEEMIEAFEKSSLPAKPCRRKANEVLLEVRAAFEKELG
jgi:predicted nucleotidyltransferase